MSDEERKIFNQLNAVDGKHRITAHGRTFIVTTAQAEELMTHPLGSRFAFNLAKNEDGEDELVSFEVLDGDS